MFLKKGTLRLFNNLQRRQKGRKKGYSFFHYIHVHGIKCVIAFRLYHMSSISRVTYKGVQCIHFARTICILFFFVVLIAYNEIINFPPFSDTYDITEDNHKSLENTVIMFIEHEYWKKSKHNNLEAIMFVSRENPYQCHLFVPR